MSPLFELELMSTRFTGAFTGMPEQWSKLLTKSAITREVRCFPFSIHLLILIILSTGLRQRPPSRPRCLGVLHRSSEEDDGGGYDDGWDDGEV